jgi:N-acyl-D-amino-acid deacylase
MDFRFGALTFTCLGLLAAGPPLAGAEEPFDLVFRGGRVVDGTGNPWFAGDVAIRGGRIVRVGRLGEAELANARKVIDVAGKVVAPGFVDMHSHSDHTLFVDGRSPSKLFQGVTTEVLGEQTSGGPYLGALEPEANEVAGAPRLVKRLADYLRALEESGIGVNVATYVGLRNVWGGAMGTSFARPTPEQFTSMKEILAGAMEDGAFGLSNAIASADAEVVTTDDLVELSRVVARFWGDLLLAYPERGEGCDACGRRGDRHRRARGDPRRHHPTSRSPIRSSGGGCPRSSPRSRRPGGAG